MNPKYKASWLRALRSGKFQQGQKFLKQLQLGSGQSLHCCLGVLCEISGVPSTYDPQWNYFYYEGKYGTLAAPIAKEMGITDRQLDELVYMNDGLRDYEEHGPRTFAQIADWIEENL